MRENTRQSREMAKGFSNAMVLRKHNPFLAKKIFEAVAHAKDEYALGFQDGMNIQAGLSIRKIPGREDMSLNEQTRARQKDMTELDLIKRGFNQGYDLKRLRPELAAQVYQGFKAEKGKNAYQQAFMSGFKTYQLEKIKDRVRNYKVLKARIKSPLKTKTRGKGREDLTKG